jgi:hypothetical protein
MYLISLIVILLDLVIGSSNDFSGYWHAYDGSLVEKNRNPKHECLPYYRNVPHHEIVRKYKLWPDTYHVDHARSDNSILFGLDYAMEAINENQHPVNCSEAKFLIGGFHYGGFGSFIHAASAPLGFAMNLGRVYLQNPSTYPQTKWEWNVPFCHTHHPGKQNLECYYEPWSSCTIYDALGPNALQLLNSFIPDSPYATKPPPEIHEINSMGGDELDKLVNDPTALKKFQESIASYKVVFIRSMGWFGHQMLPAKFVSLLHCSPMKPSFYYYWWRTISITYTMRINHAVYQWIRNHTIPSLESSVIPYTSMYIRRGDKGTEMKLVPESLFLSTLETIYSQGFINSSSSISSSTEANANATSATKRVVFLASEDSKVLHTIDDWIHDHPAYELHYTNIFDRSGMYAELDNRQRQQHDGWVPHKKGPIIPPNHPGDHHPEEYLSMLLNLHYLIKAEVYICTLASNFCRIVDELRATIGGHADKLFVDLSKETCHQVPCYQDIQDFDWRRHKI